MTNDLAAFLRARLEDDEQAAKDAGGKPWAWEQHYGDMCNDPTCEYGELATDDTVLMNVHAYDVTTEWQGAVHIARHDPARVLADVEAKRQIIEQHEPATVSYLPSRERGCVTCSTAQTWDAQANEANCQTLRLLALPYADHPEYRDEWRP
jgi:hypothetical protein